MATLTMNNNSKYNAFYRPQQTLLFTPQDAMYEDELEQYDENESDYSHNKEVWFELDLSGMGIRTLSREIRYYPHLTALYMNNNKIVELPDDIFTELRSLVVLDVSFNLLSRLPTSIGDLEHLEKLALSHNRVSELPSELGHLFKLREIYLDGNPLISPPTNILQGGAEMITSYLRDSRAPALGPPPERRFISYLEPNINIAEKDRFRVLTYNVLAESYAAPERYFYCPPWALEWDYRKHGLLKEILAHDCDIICLQEVEAGQFVGFFQPELAKAGYSGVISTKSRARTMEDWSTVDGCAVFYKRSKFSLAEEHVIEYQSIAMGRHKEFIEDPEAFSRLITKDNVAIAVVLQIKDSSTGNSPFSSPTKPGARNWSGSKKKHLLVANTHIHWNPEHRDVKLVQVQLLLEELYALLAPNSKWYNIPLILAGDFNSTPDSGPYELLSAGRLPPNHPELEPFTYGRYTHLGLEHPLQISSSYGPIGEPHFTNYTNDFEGVLDYIWYSRESLGVSKVLQPVDEEVVRATRLPNPYMHSDHIYLLSEFYLINN